MLSYLCDLWIIGDLLDHLEMLLDHLAYLRGGILHCFILPGRAFHLKLAQVFLVIFDHLFDIGLIVLRPGKLLELGHGRFVFLRDLIRHFDSKLLGEHLHLVV